MSETNCRTKILLGQSTVDKLSTLNILVVGVGGVGGYALEILTRCGIGNITIVDGDCIDITNINRQIIALHSTVGLPKVQVFKDRLLDINADLNLDCKYMRFNESTLDEIFHNKYDYVIDAIDSVQDKLLLIKTCCERNINIISAMGAGNRYEMCDYKIMDIYKTSNDGLAKKMRKLLKDNGIKSLDVVATDSKALKIDGAVGSIAYMPALAGIKLASYVINKLIEKI